MPVYVIHDMIIEIYCLFLVILVEKFRLQVRDDGEVHKSSVKMWDCRRNHAVDEIQATDAVAKNRLRR